MGFEIPISEAIKRVGSKRKYYRYVKDGLLLICRPPNAHPFHLECHFALLEENLRNKFEKHKNYQSGKFHGRRLTAIERIMMS